jgi:hypothetical protein
MIDFIFVWCVWQFCDGWSSSKKNTHLARALGSACRGPQQHPKKADAL